MVLEKTLESPFYCKENKPVNLKGNQSSILIGRAKTEALILWPPDVKSRFIRKDPGKDKKRLGKIRKDWERLKAGGEGDDRG